MGRDFPSPPAVLERVGGEAALEAALPDRPVTSLRDIQYLYGRLYTLATAGDAGHSAYLTPEYARDLLDEPESLIVVRIDLGGETPALADPAVRVMSYSEDAGHIEKVAHSYYDAARGIDHSITHRSGRANDPAKLATYAQERLTRWPIDDAVQAVADEHEDGWVIEALASLGRDKAVLTRLHDEITRKLGGPRTALVTVRVKRACETEYRWPGELTVFAKAMQRRLRSKLVTKNAASESAGEATDMLTGARTRTVGTAEDPLHYYLGKQRERYPGLDTDEGWRNHPVAEETAVTIMNSNPFLEACTYHAFGTTIYCLPYFLGAVDAHRALDLYAILRNTLGEGTMTPIEMAADYYDTDANQANEFRFYVSAVRNQQAKRVDVLGETMDGTLFVPIALATAHTDIVETWVFNPSKVPTPLRPPLPTADGWPLLSPSSGLLSQITQGTYFETTLPSRGYESEATVDEFRLHAFVAALNGDQLPVRTLPGEYVDRLLGAEREAFPAYVVAAQFAQLCAMQSVGLLAASAEPQTTLTAPPRYDDGFATQEDALMADGGSPAAARARKLEQFIGQTDAFANPERRASFLLGALVGQIGGYQRGVEDRSTTVVDQHTIKSMTKTTFKRRTQQVLDRDIVYSRKNDMTTTMYAEIVDRLRTAVTARDPDTWTLSADDLRFYYALGVSYGLNNWTDTNADDPSTAHQ